MVTFMKYCNMAPQCPLENFKKAAKTLCLTYESEIWQPYVRNEDVQISLLEPLID